MTTPGAPGVSKHNTASRPATTSLHQDSHAGLLRTPSTVGRDRMPVDAIIVPAARQVKALQAVFAAAKVLHTRLVVICSHDANATEAVAAAERCGVDIIAIDNPPRSLLPRFKTTQALVGTRFEPAATRPGIRSAAIPDTSAKRNIGLLLARMAGWERIVFVDDDIEITPEAIREAVCLLGDEWHAVGLGNHGYPDNSVVCHASRHAGGKQGTFIGAGALAVAVSKMHAFFPDVYNEDWLFLYNAVAEGRVAVVGKMAQLDYDPFASRRRATEEEFGDCLGEGLFSLLDQQLGISFADQAFWSGFLSRRRAFIAELRRHIAAMDPPGPRTKSMLDSLGAADECHRIIHAQRMVRFLADWTEDQRAWQRFLEAKVAAEQPRSIEKTLAELGLLYQRSQPPPAVVVPARAVVVPAAGSTVAARSRWRNWIGLPPKRSRPQKAGRSSRPPVRTRLARMRPPTGFLMGFRFAWVRSRMQRWGLPGGRPSERSVVSSRR